MSIGWKTLNSVIMIAILYLSVKQEMWYVTLFIVIALVFQIYGIYQKGVW